PYFSPSYPAAFFVCSLKGFDHFARLGFDTLVADAFHRGAGEPGLVCPFGIALDFLEGLVAADGGDLMRGAPSATGQICWRQCSQVAKRDRLSRVQPCPLLSTKLAARPMAGAP